MRRLKVYGWLGWRNECEPAANGNHQTREIVAATSLKEAARIVGEKGPWALNCVCETGNPEEVTLAMSKPGTVFWQPLQHRSGQPWHEAVPR